MPCSKSFTPVSPSCAPPVPPCPRQPRRPCRARTVLFDFSWVISTCVSAAIYVLLVRLTRGPGPGTPFGAAGSVPLLPEGGGEEEDSMLISVNSTVN